jgi:hypothetical protein
MAPCRELADTAIRCETIDQVFEMAKGNKFQQLREYGSAMIHLTASPAGKNGNDTALKLMPRKRTVISNRRNSKSCQTPY